MTNRQKFSPVLLLPLAAVSTVLWAAVTYSATYILNGGTATQSGQTYTSSATDTSAIWVTNSGVLTLGTPTITTSGNTTSTDNASQYGLNAAVLASASGKATLTGCTVSSSGSGANGLFATGSGSSLTMSDGSIKATGGNAHGVDVTYTGSITLTNVDITTTGGSSSGVATDFGGGTVIVTGGKVTVSGAKSAGIYSTGDIRVTGATVSATGDNGAVIDADGSILLTNTALTGSQNGLMVHNTVGQASLKAIFTINGGSLAGKGGDAFLVTGASATITAKGGASISASSGNIVNATSSSSATFTADGETLTGKLSADSTSGIVAKLQNGTTLLGAANRTALTLDATSKWTLTADSVLTTLADTAGISDSTVANIVGNGFNVYYDSTLSGNSSLGGLSYTLVNGGLLLPVGASGTSCSYTATPGTTSFTEAGGTGTVAVTTSSSCAWSAVSDSSWLAITSGASGSGAGSLSFSVEANTGAASRTGTLTVAGQSISIVETAPASTATALRFVPITPCRLVDTRLSGSTFGGNRMAAGETRTLALPSGGCAIPTSAAAYSLNVAVVPPGPLGYITLWPAGLDRPALFHLTSVDGRIRSTAAMVAAGTGGAISLYATDATELVLDINGYFVPAADSTGLAFFPVTPCRAVDTRLAAGDLGGPTMTMGQTRRFPLQGVCGLPSTAQAYSTNIAVVPATTLGYLTAWPTGTAQPLTATLNASTGAVTANAAILRAGESGAINLYASDGTDVVIDVNGYFAPAATGGLSFYTVAPCRVLDAPLAGGSTGSIAPRQSACGVSSTAQAYALHVSVVPDWVLGYITLWPAGTGQPLVATLNASDGAITSNAAIVPAGSDGGINAFVTQATRLIVDLAGYFAP